MKTKEITRNTYFYFPIFFLFLFLYYLLVFDTSLYYHNYQPIFLFDKTYLKEFLLYPGGVVELITQFFFQFFYLNFSGAFFILALISSIFIIIYNIIKKIGDFKYSLILSFLPIIFLLIIQNDYNFPLLITVKYLLTLIFFFFYVKIPERYKIFIIPLSGLIYYILGGWAYLFYVVLCALHELLFARYRRKYIYAGLNVVIYFIYTYIAARYLFMITLKEAYLYIVPLDFSMWPFNFNLNLYSYLFFLSLPTLLIALFIYLKYSKVKVKKRNKLQARFHHIPAQSIFIILILVLILTFTFEQREKKKIQIDYLAQLGRWNELLNISRGMEEYTVHIIFNVNRALYHTGQLLDNLFCYPQIVGADVLFLENVPRPIAIANSDLYFDLGHVRAAQVMAYEGHTKFGYNPRMLKRIITTNIILEEYDIAKKFLNILNKSILHKKWVKHYRNYLLDKSLIKSDSLIQLKRKFIPKVDFFIAIGERADMDLIELLKENKNNKMAFEYLMAYYLLEFRLEDLLENLGRFKELGYGKYPHYIEEAILASRLTYPERNFTVDYNINQQTIELFDRFNSILSGFENEAEAEEALRSGFYHTFWYYVFYIYPTVTKE
jgi:hypothetical protein